MKRFLLLFLMAPTVLGTVTAVVTSIDPATAGGKPQQQQDKFCVNVHSRLVCVKSSQMARTNANNATLIAKAQAEARDPDAFVNFNDEESDAAAAMFGCDCPNCIRSLRQLRAMAQVG
jgi:hypothetical protein